MKTKTISIYYHSLDSKQLTTKELKKLEKKVLHEYPFLRSVNESMLVTDNQLPDCPIIFANDSFEKMTLYPQEEIIGFNCRFLQGFFFICDDLYYLLIYLD